jgi:ribosomal protein S9
VARAQVSRAPAVEIIPGVGLFARPVLRSAIQQPLVATNRNGQPHHLYRLGRRALGPSRRGAPGISKALMNFSPTCAVTQEGGFLTRDSRVVEAKYGRPRPGARSSSQR